MDPEDVIAKCREQIRLDSNAVAEMVQSVTDVMSRENNIVEVNAPCTVVGDIHGQYYDLLHMFDLNGLPGRDKTYVFLGDYVDRGQFSCEVIITLLALKSRWPSGVILIRGNHESETVSSFFGFKDECLKKYGEVLYHLFLNAFEAMPIGALLVSNWGRVFGVHGGISPNLKTIDQIQVKGGVEGGRKGGREGWGY